MTLTYPGPPSTFPQSFSNFTRLDVPVTRPVTRKNINLTFDLDDLDLSKNEPLKVISGDALHLPSKFGEDRPKDLGGVGEQTNKQTNVAQIIVCNFTRLDVPVTRPVTRKNINLTFDLDDLDLSKNEPLKVISGDAPHLPSKFGEDRPKDLGGVGEQTNKQTDKRCSNYSMIFHRVS